MATVILVRHGRSAANTGGILAGRSPGVDLDEVGRDQVERTADRLADLPLARIVSSPLDRCRQTAQAISARHSATRFEVEAGIEECDYGDWTGRPIKELAEEPLWRTVQTQPSAATFPGGESLTAMTARSVSAVRRIDAEVTAEHGDDAIWVAVSHGDIIKAVLADALGLHLDLFQRIHVDPASISVIRHTPARPQVLGQNTHAGDLSWLAKRPEQPARDGDAMVGGGAGPE